MAARAEVAAATRERYAASGRAAKGVILDELVALTGLHRKHAIRLLRAPPEERPPRGRPRTRYGTAVKDALALLWEASDRVCSKRLAAMIPVLLPALERHGQLSPDEEMRAKLLAVSPATIDRLLLETRIAAAQGRRRRAGFSSAVRRSVPVRTFGDWGDPPPGFVEVDFVAHSGVSVAGAFVQTLVLTDIATGWTECVPVLMRAGALALEALQAAQGLFPFPLRGVDFDNDGAFMNEPVVSWCRAQGLEVTRSRAYRKNDQAWVEQKNGAIVRRLVGYGRLEGMASAAALARLYAAARLHTNLFQPSFKLRDKTRVGARVTKRWHPPATPADRALASGRLDTKSMARIAELGGRADPVIALAAIRAAQAELGERVDQRGAGDEGCTPRRRPRRQHHRGQEERRAPHDPSPSLPAGEADPEAPLDARSPPGRDRGMARGAARDDGGRRAGPAQGAPLRAVRRRPPAHHAAAGEGVAGGTGEEDDPARGSRSGTPSDGGAR